MATMTNHTPPSNSKTGHHRNETSSSSWADLVLLEDLLFPHTMEVRSNVVETVSKKLYATNLKRVSMRHTSPNGEPPIRTTFGYGTGTLDTRKLPLGVERLPRNQQTKQTIFLQSYGHGPLTTIESVSNLASGAVTPLSTTFSVGSVPSSCHRMAPSQEREMMKRLLHAASKDENSQSTNVTYGEGETSTYFGDESMSGITDNQLANENDHNTEKKYIKRFFDDLKNEREALKEEWKREFEEEQKQKAKSVHESIRERLPQMCECRLLGRVLSYLEVFFSNMPITIGAVGLSWVTQGTIWFKFMEENIDACTPAFFYSKQCSYPEFPGCFECDTSNPTYIAAVTFHYFCHCLALTCCLLFFAKCILAWTVVADELSNPTTATPIGVVCITLICVSAGRFGPIGEWTVLVTSAFHVFISFWFVYMAVVVYRLQPDPSWFPCTVGIAYAAIKTWLYYTIPGFLVMILCIIYLFSTFFVAIYRAGINQKIAAPVCFISLSAPSITMYAMTIMAQPSPQRMTEMAGAPEMRDWWHEIHRIAYLPVMHFMMFLSLVGLASSLHCLWIRWPKFKRKAFSPAHFAFIFPMLSHTNAVQAYRSGVIAYSNMAVGSPYKIILYSYWFICLIVGTVLNLVFTYKYIRKLPEWTKVNETLDPLEEAPPDPEDTEVHSLWWSKDSNFEPLKQPFTSPAVLQANEAGALVRLRRGTEGYRDHGPYIRTRHVSAYGFDLVLTDDELRQERAELLDWVAKNTARPRHRTLSIPPFFKLQPTRGQNYGSITREEEPTRETHRRTQTLGANLTLPV